MVASPLLVIVLIVLALIGASDVMLGFRTGFTSFITTPGAFFAALVGLSYAALCVCTTLIFLDRRENTFCMPMHCGSSMLAGFTASAILAYFIQSEYADSGAELWAPVSSSSRSAFCRHCITSIVTG